MRLLHRDLAQVPARDGRSTPVLAGNVLVYLADTATLVATDFRPEPGPALPLLEGVEEATMTLHRGSVVAAVRTEHGLSYLGWSVLGLRRALAADRPVEAPHSIDPLLVHPRRLPSGRGRVHHGMGTLRLVVEHDPVTGPLAALYERSVHAPPGPYLLRRAANPKQGSALRTHLRPQLLHQVPVPVPGGTLVLGRLRWFGESMEGAMLVPTVQGGRD